MATGCKAALRQARCLLAVQLVLASPRDCRCVQRSFDRLLNVQQVSLLLARHFHPDICKSALRVCAAECLIHDTLGTALCSCIANCSTERRQVRGAALTDQHTSALSGRARCAGKCKGDCEFCPLRGRSFWHRYLKPRASIPTLPPPVL